MDSKSIVGRLAYDRGRVGGSYAAEYTVSVVLLII